MTTLSMIEALARTTDEGRHTLMLTMQHMLEHNPHQTLAEAIGKVVGWRKRMRRSD